MRKAEHKKPFIYYKSLEKWEVICLLLYGFITLGVVLTVVFAEPEAKQGTIIMYIVCSQFGMYFGLYTSLRNFTSYLCWIGFGLLHLLLFLLFRQNPSLDTSRGNAAIGLLNTIVLLLLFQLLRYLSLKIQHREFVAPEKGGGTDLFEDKKVTFSDSIIFVIYFAALFGLTTFWLSM